eukprot:8758797-Pyramimonas_sp.AAC.1
MVAGPKGVMNLWLRDLRSKPPWGVDNLHSHPPLLRPRHISTSDREIITPGVRHLQDLALLERGLLT